jgi:hypothetical protein
VPHRVGARLGDMQELRQTIDAIVQTQAKSEYRLRLLTDGARQQLIADLVHAVGSAWVGLSGAVRGSRSKPAAWNLELFVYDVCWAVWSARLPVTANRDPKLSLAQALARQVAIAAGLAGHGGRVGSLYREMKCARTFVGARDPNDEPASAWLDGRVVAELK